MFIHLTNSRGIWQTALEHEGTIPTLKLPRAVTYHKRAAPMCLSHHRSQKYDKILNRVSTLAGTDTMLNVVSIATLNEPLRCKGRAFLLIILIGHGTVPPTKALVRLLLYFGVGTGIPCSLTMHLGDYCTPRRDHNRQIPLGGTQAGAGPAIGIRSP